MDVKKYLTPRNILITLGIILIIFLIVRKMNEKKKATQIAGKGTEKPKKEKAPKVASEKKEEGAVTQEESPAKDLPDAEIAMLTRTLRICASGQPTEEMKKRCEGAMETLKEHGYAWDSKNLRIVRT